MCKKGKEEETGSKLRHSPTFIANSAYVVCKDDDADIVDSQREQV